ncbi:MAG: SpoIID/LytB domain-containing protein [Spirulina sp. SIO3F2]|nr:SpoIID/LytB domain-containing protein [Spirulina sp. SIO3F2]
MPLFRISRWATIALLTASATLLPTPTRPQTAPPSQATNRILEVGIVQRFGQERSDRLVLKPISGDRLTVEFANADGSIAQLQTTQLTLEIRDQPLAEPQPQEWVVLSDHATFETAEHSAKQWASRGVVAEVTQPGRWQVWADRQVYNTPLLRRKLLENLKEAGETEPYLQSEVLNATPKVSFQIGNYRYNRDRLQITSGQQRIQVAADGKTIPYGGTLTVQPNAYGDFTLVNEVPMETYLRGVVPHEIGPQAPYTAVQAQTVIARTYALRNLRRFRADEYELCATVHCQVYKGLSGTVERADRAIQTTQGQVLTYDNQLVDALYSAHTGGITSPFEDIWDGEARPYLQARIDAANPPWDLTQTPLNSEAAIRAFLGQEQGFNGTDSPVFRWQRQSTITELTADLDRYLTRTKNPLAGIQRIVRMAVTERSPSGRILTLSITTDKGIVELHKTEARSALGPPRSTLFYLEPLLDAQNNLTGYRFIGGGFGHGVGLNQYGSYTLARQGWNYAQILNFYYPGTSLQPFQEKLLAPPTEIPES